MAIESDRAARKNKIDIFNCFADGRGGWKDVDVVVAQIHLGKELPRHLIRRCAIDRHITYRREFYRLTEDGKTWLIDGLRRRLARSPQEASKLKVPVDYYGIKLRNTRR